MAEDITTVTVQTGDWVPKAVNCTKSLWRVWRRDPGDPSQLRPRPLLIPESASTKCG